MNRPRSRRYMAALAAAALLPVLPAAHTAAVALQPSAEGRAVATLLHQGRFDAASDAARVLSARRGSDPEGPILQALTTWWRLLDTPKDPNLLSMLDERLVESVRRGEALLRSPDAQRGRILAGTALVLAAHSRALAGRYFAAGSAARQGNAYLEDAFKADPEGADAGFALGAYKYYAAKLPWIVRALRIFVFIPGGSVREGLEALNRAADKGEFFRSEALLLLTYLNATEDDGDPRKALEYLARARAMEPGSPLFAAVEARFQFSLGRLTASERAAREAIELASSPPQVAPQIPALAKLRLGLSLYYQYRPVEALSQVEPLLAAEADLVGDAAASARALHARLISDLGLPAAAPAPASPPPAEPQVSIVPPRLVSAAPVPRDAEAAAALEKIRNGVPAEAALGLTAALSRAPEDHVTRYHLARAYQAAGRSDEGIAELRRVLADGVPIPRTLQGWALIRLGDALGAQGNPGEAERSYKRAASLRGFVFSRAAEDRLRHPADRLPPEG